MALDYLPILAKRSAPRPPRKLQTIAQPAWHPLTRTLPEMRIALITSGAFREESQAPFPPLGDASYRKVSCEPESAALHMDHRSHLAVYARRDHETVFPRRALKALAAQGLIGDVSPYHFSIYGGIRAYQDIDDKLAPALTEQLKQEKVDLAVFLPF